jgi:methylenetetrahydrofolate reductase (NADPH)
MNNIRDIYAARRGSPRPVISCEFFAPKTDEGDQTLLAKTIPALLKVKPDYCSVTYGALGTTRHKTIGLVERIQREHNWTAMCHLTCVSATRGEIGEIVDEIAGHGIRNILALRGDPPGGVGEFQKPADGFEYARELVEYLRARGGFSIGVAGCPEGHIACKAGKVADWQHLKEKIAAGADFVVTQLFYDNAYFHEFTAHLRDKLNVRVPIVPGVLPITAAVRLEHLTQLCGASIPPALLARLRELAGNEEALNAFGVEFATRQCEDLVKAGVPGLHFYTMNRSKAVTQIVRNLKLV